MRGAAGAAAVVALALVSLLPRTSAGRSPEVEPAEAERAATPAPTPTPPPPPPPPTFDLMRELAERLEQGEAEAGAEGEEAGADEAGSAPDRSGWPIGVSLEAGLLLHAPGSGGSKTDAHAALVLRRRLAWLRSGERMRGWSGRRLEWESRLGFSGSGHGIDGALAPGAGSASLELEVLYALPAFRLDGELSGAAAPAFLYTGVGDRGLKGLRERIAFGLDLSLALGAPGSGRADPERVPQAGLGLYASRAELPRGPGGGSSGTHGLGGPALGHAWTPLVRMRLREPVSRTGALVLDARFEPMLDSGSWSLSAAWALPLDVLAGK